MKSYVPSLCEGFRDCWKIKGREEKIQVKSILVGIRFLCDIQNESGLSKAEMSLSFRVNSASMVAPQSQERSFFCPQPCLPLCPRCGFLLDMVPHCAQ